MTRSQKLSTAHVVRRPRTVDGIGSALRDVFSPDGAGLPADMRALLCAIDSRSQRR